jgi:hypothetical protein
MRSGDGKPTMKNTGNIRSRTIASTLVLAATLLAFQPAVTAATETVKVTTSTWRIHKPSREFKDLPTLLPKEQNGFDAGIGQFEFACLKSTYYMLLVQPSVKLHDAEQGSITVHAAHAGNGAAPTPLTFRNLYKTKSPLSRSLNWDADVHYAEVSAALLASIKAAGDLELTLADRNYAVALSDFGSRLGSFQRFCENSVVDDPAHFD